MNGRKNPLLLFTIGLLGVLVSALMIHLAVLNRLKVVHTFFDLLWPYVANYTMTGGITWLLYRWRKKYASSLGFIFMMSSMLKFTVFFIFFYPYYLADETVLRVEFGWFFIPYSLSLAVETAFLVWVMSRVD